jgi:aspartyl/asparaginyl-tRNA synthetase
MDVEPMRSYLDCFRYGRAPYSGLGLGAWLAS